MAHVVTRQFHLWLVRADRLDETVALDLAASLSVSPTETSPLFDSALEIASIIAQPADRHETTNNFRTDLSILFFCTGQ